MVGRVLARKSLLIVLNNVLGAAIGFFALRFITAMPVGAYGYYVWAMSTIGIAALINALGFTQAHVKRVSEGLDEPRANGTFFLIKLVLTFLFVVGVAGWFYFFRFVLHRRFTDSTTDAVFLIVLVIYTVLSLRQFYDTTFQAHRHTARQESVLLVDTVVSFLGLAGVYYVIQRAAGQSVPLEPLVAAFARALGVQGHVSPELAGALVATAYLVGKCISLCYAALQFHLHHYPIGAPSAQVYRDYRTFGVPLAIIGGITVLYGNIDRFLLGVWYDKENVEIFQVNYQVLTPMLFVAVAVGNLLFPSFSQYDAGGDARRIQTETRRAERYISMLIVPQIVLAFVFAHEGMVIFRARYAEHAHLVQIFALFVYLNSIAVPTRSILLGTGRTRRILGMVLVNLVVVLGLNLVLVPQWAGGLAETGAAIVVVIASVVSYVQVRLYTSDLAGRGWLPPGAVRHFAAGVLIGGAWWLARATLGGQYFSRFWQLMLVGVLTGVVYVGLLALMREFRRSDWDFFWDIVHPQKLAGYVGDELAPKNKP
jgi:O-antigen/teichoic acid export membrane protein